MLIALMCHDKPGRLETRKSNREAHLAYIADTGVVAMAGPLISTEGDMCGSLIVLDVEDQEDAESWAENDPYAIAGLFESVTIRQWNKVIG